jgi:hypothetical protein
MNPLDNVRCSFCSGRHKPEYVITADGDGSVAICDRCIAVVATIAKDEYGDGPGPVREVSPCDPLTVPIGRLRQNVSKQRERLGRDQGWSCRYCSGAGDEDSGPDGRAWHVDHLYPVVRGGDSQPDNLVLACATCNLKKRAQLLTDFLCAPAPGGDSPEAA